MEKRIADNGWKLVAKSDVVITANMEIGGQVTKTYKPIVGPEQTVTIQEYKSSVEIKAKGQEAFSSSISNVNLPAAILLSSNETLQQYLDRRSVQPTPAYFERLPIPNVITDRKPVLAAGRSSIGSDGVKVFQETK